MSNKNDFGDGDHLQKQAKTTSRRTFVGKLAAAAATPLVVGFGAKKFLDDCDDAQAKGTAEREKALKQFEADGVLSQTFIDFLRGHPAGPLGSGEHEGVGLVAGARYIKAASLVDVDLDNFSTTLPAVWNGHIHSDQIYTAIRLNDAEIMAPTCDPKNGQSIQTASGKLISVGSELVLYTKQPELSLTLEPGAELHNVRLRNAKIKIHAEKLDLSASIPPEIFQAVRTTGYKNFDDPLRHVEVIFSTEQCKAQGAEAFYTMVTEHMMLSRGVQTIAPNKNILLKISIGDIDALIVEPRLDGKTEAAHVLAWMIQHKDKLQFSAEQLEALEAKLEKSFDPQEEQKFQAEQQRRKLDWETRDVQMPKTRDLLSRLNRDHQGPER